MSRACNYRCVSGEVTPGRSCNNSLGVLVQRGHEVLLELNVLHDRLDDNVRVADGHRAVGVSGEYFVNGRRALR